MNLVITETKNGPRVHRATCKRQGASSPLKEAMEFAPGTVALAKPATCCKPTMPDIWPSITSEDLAAAAEASKAAHGTKQVFTPDRPDEEVLENLAHFTVHEDEIVARFGEDVLATEPELHTAEALFVDPPKHFWGALATHALNDLHVDVQTSKFRVLVHSTTEDEAWRYAKAIEQMWQEARDELRRFKATDTVWQGMPHSGPEAHTTSYARLREHLATWGRARVLELVS